MPVVATNTAATPRLTQQPVLNNRTDANAEVAETFKPQLIYNATLGLRVDRLSVVQERAEAVVESYGGYIGDSSPGRMQVRVPADRFEVALDALAALGHVNQRMVKAEEASERVVDLESRLRSLHALRDRLIAMIDRAENIEHALKVQLELARVIDQIELINGRLRLTKQQIAYATIDLSISPTPAEQRLTPGIPVAWVRDLGRVFSQRNTIDVTTPRRLRDGVSIDLPDGFIKTSQENYVTQAIDANGVQIRVRRQKNFEGGSTKFWQQLITRSLDDNAGLKLDAAHPVTFERGKAGQLILGSKTIAGETVRYMIAVGVASDKDYVYTFEAWGVAEHFDVAEDDLKSAIGSMRCY
ncbi:MAG: DUF4349 domain-containing protein [Phycisphaeraceae bacterium]